MFWDGPSSMRSTSPGGPLRDQTSMEPHDHGSSVDFDAVVASKSLAKLPEDRRILMCEVADLKRRLRIKEGECDSLMFRVNDNLMFQVQADKYTGLYEQLYSEHKTCESRRQKWKLKKLATLDKLAKAEKKNEDHLVRSTTAEEENLRLVQEKEMAAAAHEVERVRLVREKEMAAAAHEVERVRLVREKEMAAAAHEVERGNLDKEIAEVKSRLESDGEKYAELLAKHKDFHGAAQNRLQHLERENQELRNQGMKFQADCRELYQQMGLAQEKIQILEETNRKLASHSESILKENQALHEHMKHCHGNWKKHADKLHQVERENEELLMKFEADCQELYQQVRLAQEKSQSLKVTNLKLASQREFILKENQALQTDTRIAQVGGGAQIEGQMRQIEEQQRQIGDNQALAQEIAEVERKRSDQTVAGGVSSSSEADPTTLGTAARDIKSSSATFASKASDADLPQATVVVGLDFGTTFSGFAFAHTSKPQEVKTFFEWPETRGAGVPIYCKTPTSLYYRYCEDGSYLLQNWGWPAHVAHSEDVMAAAKAAKHGGQPLANRLLTKFKLHLAGEENIRSSILGPSTADPLPHGLTPELVVTDYLREMGAHIMKIIQFKYGEQLSIEKVKWCLTVPAHWGADVKLKMVVCSEKAGLVQGHHTPPGVTASPHPITIVLEAEAAALACWSELGDHLKIGQGEHLLVADIGRATVDIVVLERVNQGSEELKLKEVAHSSCGLCGGTFVDQAYLDLLKERIPCFQDHVTVNGRVLIGILKQWHELKSVYDGGPKSCLTVEIPPTLTAAWKRYDKEHGVTANLKDDEDYEELRLNNSDIEGVFQPTVSEIMRLIHAKMTGDVKVVMVVGGFSASPYLMARIKSQLGHQVRSIINPKDPGAAICCGAVLTGLNPQSIASRISKKSYGVKMNKPFDESVHPKEKRSDHELLHKSEVEQTELHKHLAEAQLVKEGLVQESKRLQQDNQKLALDKETLGDCKQQ